MSKMGRAPSSSDSSSPFLTQAAASATYAAVIAVDGMSGATDDAKMQAAIDLAAANIAAGLGPVEVRLSGRSYSWSGSTPTLPVGLAAKLIVNLNGSRVVLSTAAPAFLNINRTADYQTFKNVSIRDGWIDCNNVAGAGHVILGTTTWVTGGSPTFLSRLNIDSIDIRDVRAYNIPTDPAGGDYRAGVFLSPLLNGAAGEAQVNVTNVKCRNVRVQGGRFGLVVGSQSTTAGNVFVDDVVFEHCWHDTGIIPTVFLACTNFFIGCRGHGGRAVIRDSYGKGSGDDGLEFDGMSVALADNVTIEECTNVAFLHHNFALPNNQQAQKITFRNCHARVSSAVVTTSATPNMLARGFLFNTKPVQTTTTAIASAGATTITLATLTPVTSEQYFPTSGVVTDGTQTITYTGLDTVNKQLTGVTGIGVDIPSGTTISLVNDVASFELLNCSFMKQGQGYWEYQGDAFRAVGGAKKITVDGFEYVLLNTAASISTPSTPAGIYIEATPFDPAAPDPVVTVKNVTMRLTGSRTGGSTADWAGVDINGTGNLLIELDQISIDNQMTGMSLASSIDGVRLGRAHSSSRYSVNGIGVKIRSLGDVGASQRGIRQGDSSFAATSMFRWRSCDFAGMSTAGVAISNNTGTGKNRTVAEDIIWNTANGMMPQTTITPTTGTFTYQNTTQQKGAVTVSGGTVSQIQLNAGGSVKTTGLLAGTFPVMPGDSIVVTNTVIPTAMFFTPIQ